MAHPLQAIVMGFNGMIISYAHYYFCQDPVLLTHAYAMSTTATTVGDEATYAAALSLMMSQTQLLHECHRISNIFHSCPRTQLYP